MSEQADQAAAMAAIQADMDPNKGYCGLEWLWNRPASDPFNSACQWHDQEYDLMHAGFEPGTNSNRTDEIFLGKMLAIAGDNTALQLLAHAYHFIASEGGRLLWEKNKETP